MSAQKAEILAAIAASYSELGGLYAQLAELSGDSETKPPAGKGKAKAEELPPASAAKGKGAAAGKAKAKVVTEDDVRAAAKKLIDAKGKEAAIAVLSEFGNGKLADVEESDYAACIARMEAAMAAEDETGGDVDDI